MTLIAKEGDILELPAVSGRAARVSADRNSRLTWGRASAWRRQVPPLGLRLVRGLVPGQHVRGDAPPVGDLEALSAGPRPDVGLVMPGRARASCCPPG